MADRLPLFPLDVVLFPGSLLPLHIFEPQYRALLADCMAGDRRFGLLPKGEAEERPATGVVGTVALIRATQPLPDGRANVVVSGERRFMLRRYLEGGTPYMVGLVEPFEDDEADAEGAADLPEIRRLADRCADALEALTDTAPDRTWSTDPGEMSFQVASLLQLDTGFKQRFLGIRSAAERTVVLLQILPELVADLEVRALVRRRARRNGAGGQRPDIAVAGE